MSELEGLLSKAVKSDEPDEIRLPLLKQIGTNLLVTCLLLRYRFGVELPRLGDAMKAGVAVLSSTMDALRISGASGSSLYVSRFVNTILALARWSIEDDPNERLRLARKAAEFCRASLASPEMPYDVQRFTFFLELLEPESAEKRLDPSD